uniref:Uncharacterized protein n=1 Tax=Cucumis melo TaxID=3656 RepID=A0A9I9EEV2_CUCME
MAKKLPGCQVRATTVIHYRIKTLKGHSRPSPKCVGQCAVALGGTMKRNVSLRRKNYLII